jgi:hypothetical protein
MEASIGDGDAQFRSGNQQVPSWKARFSDLQGFLVICQSIGMPRPGQGDVAERLVELADAENFCVAGIGAQGNALMGQRVGFLEFRFRDQLVNLSIDRSGIGFGTAG